MPCFFKSISKIDFCAMLLSVIEYEICRIAKIQNYLYYNTTGNKMLKSYKMHFLLFLMHNLNFIFCFGEKYG